jgi:hypothetical protein
MLESTKTPKLGASSFLAPAWRILVHHFSARAYSLHRGDVRTRTPEMGERTLAKCVNAALVYPAEATVRGSRLSLEMPSTAIATTRPQPAGLLACMRACGGYGSDSISRHRWPCPSRQPYKRQLLHSSYSCGSTCSTKQFVRLPRGPSPSTLLRRKPHLRCCR